MKAIVNTAPDRLEMLDRPLPEPGPGQVRIRSGACAICATDLIVVAGLERTSFPTICGHEWAGTVDAIGPDVDAALAGRRCVAENVLSDGGEVGFQHPGAYAQYFLTEAANVHLLPDAFPFSTAALIEPLAVCVRAMRRLRSDAADPVLIFGDGPIGLLMLMLLVRQGAADIVLVGGREQRLTLARELGAGRTLNYRALGENLALAIQQATEASFPTVVEASGSPAAMNAALERIAHPGRILVLGDYGRGRAAFAWNDLLHREIELIGSCASANAWPEAVRLAVQGVFPLDRLITHRRRAEQFREGWALMRARRGDVLKVVLEWS